MLGSPPIAWVVADEQADADAAARALHPHFRVERVAGEALAGSRIERPDLLLVHRRSTADSIALLAELRGRFDAKALPIVLIGEDDELPSALAAGASDFVALPLRASELLARARAHARRCGSERAEHPMFEAWSGARLGGPASSELWSQPSLLRELFMQAPMAVAVWSGPELVHELANSLYLRLSGRTASDLIGKPLLVAFPELGPDSAVLRMLERVYATGQPLTADEQHVVFDRQGDGRLADGYFQLAVQPIIDEQGRTFALVSVGVEVTRQVEIRQRLEQLTLELQRSEDRYRTLADNAPDSICRYDRECRFLFANPATAEITGMPLEAMFGRTHAELGFPPDLVESWTGYLQQVLDKGEPIRHEFRFGHRDGETLEFEAWLAPERNVDGWIESVLVISRDVTEQRKAKRALEDNERRYRATFDNAPIGIAHLGVDGRWLHFNDRLLEITGYSREELQQKTVEDITHPDDRAADRANVAALYDGRINHYQWEKRYIRKDGSIVWVNLTRSTIRKPTGEPSYYVAVIEDITSRKQVEEALRESDRQKDEFLAVLGHELRNPMAAIRTASELLRLAGPTDPRIRRVQGVLDRQTSHVARLLDDLLDISRITQGKLTLSRATIDLVEVVRHAVDDRRDQLAARGLELRLALADSPLWVEGDVVRLAQVTDNLIANAIKYTEAPGLVTISVAREGDHAVLRVLDSGVGLQPEFRRQLFRPFHQAPQDIARSAGGLGLGLAISKGIVELHGGTIDAHSRGRDQGTEFIVRIPICDEPPLVACRVPDPREPASRVLVVEDNEDFAQLLAELLQRDGHDVLVAYSGRQAIELASHTKPDMVLCDIGLPDISGYEVARTLSADEQLQGTRLIAISGYGQPEDRRRSADAGFDAHLTKPVTLDALRDLLAPNLKPS